MNTFPIYDALNDLKLYLELKAKENKLTNPTMDWNVSLNSLDKDGQKDEEKNDIVITLLRIEEETSRKTQQPNYSQWAKVGGEISNPEIWVNLYILISSQTNVYETALRQISTVIYWINTIHNSRHYDPSNTNVPESVKKVFDKITSYSIELQSLTTEQSNSLWQTLGTNIVPAVVYKIRMVEIGSSGYMNTPFGYVGIDQDGNKFDTKTASEWPIQLTDGSLRLKLMNGESLKDDEKEHLVILLKQLEDKFYGTQFQETVLSKDEKAFLKSNSSK